MSRKMNSLEQALWRAGKTRAQFDALHESISPMFRTWLAEVAEDNEGAWSAEEILAAKPVVFAVWHGGFMMVKGFMGNPVTMKDIGAVKCASEVEAHGLIA